MNDAEPSRRRKRGRAVAAVGVVVLAAGAAATAAVGVGGGGQPAGTPAGADLPPGTAHVSRQTIVDTDEESGSLGYGTTTALAGRIPGVVTRMPLPGAVIGRGRSIYRVDNTPVVLLIGDVAAYRSLEPGSVGADVRQLETNLTALGYGGYTVDKNYTRSTATAVRRWQKALGLPGPAASSWGGWCSPPARSASTRSRPG